MLLKIVLLILFLLITPSKVQAFTATIEMTDSGFIPAEISLNQNDEIIFLNKSTKDRWPASNIHPTHGIYPEFDPKKPIPLNESWTFKFDKPGSFKFHDHLIPTFTGTVNVIKKDEAKPTASPPPPNYLNQAKVFFSSIYYKFFPSQLEKKLNSLDFYKVTSNEDELSFWVGLLGPEKYMKKLVRDTKGGTRVDCHQEAHKIGRQAYKIDSVKAFEAVDYSCHSGYLHGAMESFILEKGTQHLIGEIEALCKGPNFSTDFAQFECLHGIGHGLMAFEDYNLPKTIQDCSQLSSEYEIRSCYGGVFMENIMTNSFAGGFKTHQSLWLSEDPLFPCNGIDQNETVQFECYQMQTSRMLQLNNYKFESIPASCLKAPKDMIPVCFKSMGRDVAGQSLRDPDKIIKNCSLVPTQYYQQCISGAFNVIVDFWGETMKDQPVSLCKKLQGSEDKEFCYSLLAQRLLNVFGRNSQKINEICQFSEPEYLQTCKQG